MKKGFTLIEMLVVVLIIGILAAVALPQYKFAVEKTKISRYLTIGQSIRSAQERFYMAQGEYTESLSDLDIDIDSLCKSRAGSHNIFYNCMDKSIEIDNAMGSNPTIKGYLTITYCSSLSNTTQSSWKECPNNADLEVEFYYSNYYYNAALNNQTVCRGYTEKGNRLCKLLGY